tara:strand:- start:271 stop:570 length:300 start_codon:yes stop_codon:yes gene_type:complete
MTQIEVKMIINTDNGVKNVNFFTTIDIFQSKSENEFFNMITKEIDLMILKYEKYLLSGYAMAMHNNKEIFSFEFMKTSEGREVQWKNLMMSLVKNPTIH